MARNKSLLIKRTKEENSTNLKAIRALNGNLLEEDYLDACTKIVPNVMVKAGMPLSVTPGVNKWEKDKLQAKMLGIGVVQGSNLEQLAITLEKALLACDYSMFDDVRELVKKIIVSTINRIKPVGKRLKVECLIEGTNIFNPYTLVNERRYEDTTNPQNTTYEALIRTIDFKCYDYCIEFVKQESDFSYASIYNFLSVIGNIYRNVSESLIDIVSHPEDVDFGMSCSVAASGRRKVYLSKEDDVFIINSEISGEAFADYVVSDGISELLNELICLYETSLNDPNYSVRMLIDAENESATDIKLKQKIEALQTSEPDSLELDMYKSIVNSITSYQEARKLVYNFYPISEDDDEKRKEGFKSNAKLCRNIEHSIRDSFISHANKAYTSLNLNAKNLGEYSCTLREYESVVYSLNGEDVEVLSKGITLKHSPFEVFEQLALAGEDRVLVPIKGLTDGYRETISSQLDFEYDEEEEAVVAEAEIALVLGYSPLYNVQFNTDITGVAYVYAELDCNNNLYLFEVTVPQYYDSKLEAPMTITIFATEELNEMGVTFPNREDGEDAMLAYKALYTNTLNSLEKNYASNVGNVAMIDGEEYVIESVVNNGIVITVKFEEKLN